MNNRIIIFLFSAALITFTASCKKSNPVVVHIVEPNPVFRALPDTLKFSVSGGNDTLTVNMNGTKWEAFSSQTWVGLSFTSSIKASDKLIVTAAANSTGSIRTATLSLVMDNKTTVLVNISQNIAKITYPDYSSPVPSDPSGMNSTAKALVSQISLGWNLGNTLEVPVSAGGETGWGNALTTQTLIDSVKAAGFNAIRLPCAWDSHSDPSTGAIDPAWLARVKQVLNYCYNDNMYVIINIHWDGGWLENNCLPSKQVAVNLKQRALWEQIAMYFRDYDEHLLFAGCNEPNASDATGMAVLLTYEQTFINAVRSTGGRNSYRTLICQAPSTNIDYAVSYMTTLPTDITVNRLAFEVHDYDPYQFSSLNSDASWGNMFYFWGATYHQAPVDGVDRNASWGEESYFISEFAKIKAKFIDNGFPVILGEFGAMRRLSLTGSNLTNHLASRAYYLQYVVTQAKNYGLAPFYWDAGFTGDQGTGLFTRSTGVLVDQQGLKALVTGAANGTYPY